MVTGADRLSAHFAGHEDLFQVMYGYVRDYEQFTITPASGSFDPTLGLG